MAKLLRREEVPESAEATRVEALIEDLANQDVSAREKARAEMLKAGGEAVDPLSRAMGDPRPEVRWEVARVLAELQSPAALLALVAALEDEDGSVRWVAADGLISLGRDALRPVLEGLLDRSGSRLFREGAHRVLRHQISGEMHEVAAPVLAALEHSGAEAAVPLAAEDGLDRLRLKEAERRMRRR